MPLCVSEASKDVQLHFSDKKWVVDEADKVPKSQTMVGEDIGIYFWKEERYPAQPREPSQLRPKPAPLAAPMRRKQPKEAEKSEEDMALEGGERKGEHKGNRRKQRQTISPEKAARLTQVLLKFLEMSP